MKKHLKTKKKITNQIIFDQFAKIDQRFEQLELSIKLGFDEVDARFDEVDQRFTAVDLRFNAVDQNFIDLEVNFDQKIRHAVAPLPTKDFVDQRIGQLRGEFVHSKHNLA